MAFVVNAPEFAAVMAELRESCSWWNSLSSPLRQELMVLALPLEATSFVAHSNELEGVDTLTSADTQKLVDELTVSPTTSLLSEKQKATIGTYRAHRLAHGFRKQKISTAGDTERCCNELLLTVQEVRMIHRELMSELHGRAGRFRVTPAKPIDRDDLYFPWQVVESSLFSLLDLYNTEVVRLFGNGNDVEFEDRSDDDSDTSLDEDGLLDRSYCDQAASAGSGDFRNLAEDTAIVSSVISLASWIAYYLLEIHPFSDGNGRLTRIILDTILAFIHPVPAPLVPDGMTKAEARSAYIAALRLPLPLGTELWNQKPEALPMLIARSLASSWRRLRTCYFSRSLCFGGAGPWIGPLVLRRSRTQEHWKRQYVKLAHSKRAAPPSAEVLEAEAAHLVPPEGTIPAGGTSIRFAPSGVESDGWTLITWID